MTEALDLKKKKKTLGSSKVRTRASKFSHTSNDLHLPKGRKREKGKYAITYTKATTQHKRNRSKDPHILYLDTKWRCPAYFTLGIRTSVPIGQETVWTPESLDSYTYQLTDSTNLNAHNLSVSHMLNIYP
jgi:hypothetical protein